MSPSRAFRAAYERAADRRILLVETTAWSASAYADPGNGVIRQARLIGA